MHNIKLSLINLIFYYFTDELYRFLTRLEEEPANNINCLSSVFIF